MITHALGSTPRALGSRINGRTIRSLFRRHSPGIWYDPQDLTTLYQDASGTLPVYRPGTGKVDPPVGLMLDKSQGLELGPELFVPMEGYFDANDTNGIWAAYTPGTLSCDFINIKPNVFYELNSIGGASDRYRLQYKLQDGTFTLPIVKYSWVVEVIVTPSNATQMRLYFNSSASPATAVSIREIKGYHAYRSTTTARPTLSGRYNLLTATEALSTQSVKTVATSYTLSFSGTGTITLSGTATGTYSAGTHTITCTAGTLTCTVAGSVTRADLRVANDGGGLPPYQRVVDANTYDTAGFPLYLKFDGVDDFLQTASVDLTGTDEITIGAGSQRFGGGNYVRLYELTSDISTNVGAFVCMSPETAASNNIMFSMRGTTSPASAYIPGNTVSKKIASLFSGKLSADSYSVSVNSGDPVIITGDFGTGNFSNSTLFVGARGMGPQYFFNGRFYSLCIIGSLLPTSEQAVLKRYLNAKTRAY